MLKCGNKIATASKQAKSTSICKILMFYMHNSKKTQNLHE